MVVLFDLDDTLLRPHRCYESSWVLFDDVQECLEGLSGCRLGVVSNGPGREKHAKIVTVWVVPNFQDCPS